MQAPFPFRQTGYRQNNVILKHLPGQGFDMSEKQNRRAERKAPNKILIVIDYNSS